MRAQRVGFAVATAVVGMLVSDILGTMAEAERLALRLGCRWYIAVEVRQ